MNSDMFLALVLIALAAVTTIVNAPGHISFDSVIQLHEGKTGVYRSFNPPFMGFLMAGLDHIVPGVELFFLLNIAIFFTSLFFF